MRKELKRKPGFVLMSLKLPGKLMVLWQEEPAEMCRAQAMYNILTKIPVFISEGHLLAGNGAGIPGRA